MKQNVTLILQAALQRTKVYFKPGCCFLAFMVLQLSMLAQTGARDISLSGKVTSVKGEALAGVTIRVKNSALVTTTNATGDFTLTLPENAVLELSYVGFTSQEFAVNGKTQVSITLGAGDNNMAEVVVVGYTSQKKASISGAVATVNMNELSKTRIADVAQALQGQVAGVVVSANTGAPGDGIKVRIRGEGTLGNNDALYVVDGVATRDISFLNQSDIKSITVLKDASATAIYGSRAAAGVVVITTNMGQKGKSSFDIDFNVGSYKATRLPDMLNADQYLTVKDQAWHNTTGNGTTAVSPYAADRNRTDLANTNWLNELFEAGKSKSLQLTASGGSDKVQYLLSAGYYGIDGIIVEDHDKYERFNFRTNVNAQLSDRFKLGTNLQMTYEKKDKLSSSGDRPGVIRHALLRSPVVSVYKSITDPTYTASNPYTDLPFYRYVPDPNNAGNFLGLFSSQYEQSSNPLAIVHFNDDKRNSYRTFGNVYGEYSFLRDNALKFRSSFGVDILFDHNKKFAQNFGDDNNNDRSDPYPGAGRNNRPNNLDENLGESLTFNFSNTLNYNRTFHQKHSINALVGMESITNKNSGIGGSRQNFEDISYPFRYLDYGSEVNMHSGGSESNWALLSYFGSATYGYESKYFATASLRADASSRFGPNNKWGYFPSIAAGWIVSKENFMKDIAWVNNLKLRGSWGNSGNQEIPDHTYETLVTKVGGVKITRFGNPDVKWEVSTQTNVGMDLTILKNRFTVSADYFVKTTKDILLTVQLPALAVGEINRTYVNAGEVTNKGFELALNYRNADHPVKYNANLNVATLKNNVGKLYTYVKSIEDGATHTVTTTGHPISSYYGFQFDGIYQNTAEITKTLFTNSNGVQPGDIKYKDINADGQINAADRTFIGNPIPKLTYGFSFSVDYRNFDFSFLIQGVKDVDRYNDLKKILDYDSRPFNSTTAVLGAWHGEGTSNTIPRNTFNDNGGGFGNDNGASVFVEDASYLRLKNIELGYTVSSKVMGLKNIRLYVSGQNVFTKTDYTGLDPESTSLLDQGTYPQTKSFIIGAKIKL
ncbi:MAG: TonB-dependent receptor [Ferruginibacter sp.]